MSSPYNSTRFNNFSPSPVKGGTSMVKKIDISPKATESISSASKLKNN